MAIVLGPKGVNKVLMASFGAKQMLTKRCWPALLFAGGPCFGVKQVLTKCGWPAWDLTDVNKKLQIISVYSVSVSRSRHWWSKKGFA